MLYLSVAQKMQDLCAAAKAVGLEVWFIGYRFIFSNGKYSKIYSKKDLGFDTGTVWINLQNFKESKKSVYRKIHPDCIVDKNWGTRLSQWVSDCLLSGSESRYQLLSSSIVVVQRGFTNTPGQGVQGEYINVAGTTMHIDEFLRGLKRRETSTSRGRQRF